MVDGKTVLGLVVARGGSKGLPRKNVLDLGGRPLVAWTVAAGLASKTIDRLIISTDDTEIANAARAAGAEVPFLRPDHLAGDGSGSADVVIHALDSLDQAYDYVVLLQATSPLRLAEDIDGAVALCHERGATSCFAITEMSPPPYWALHLSEDGRVHEVLPPPPGVLRRQDLPHTYVTNGAVYVVQTEWFRRTRVFEDHDTLGYVMPPERSVDIDTKLDLLLARAIVANAASPT